MFAIRLTGTERHPTWWRALVPVNAGSTAR